MKQPLLGAPVAHELHDLDEVLLRPIHFHGKVGPHLEKLLELPVISVERIVRGRIADQDHFDIKRDGLGSEGLRDQDPRLRPHLFDANALVAQCLLEGLPRQRLAQQDSRIQYEIAAVRPV